jgi:hypothetical protein
LTVAANLTDTAFAAPGVTRGRTLLATTTAGGGQWPPWYVEWSLE